jgi:hypothetical protein
MFCRTLESSDCSLECRSTGRGPGQPTNPHESPPGSLDGLGMPCLGTGAYPADLAMLADAGVSIALRLVLEEAEDHTLISAKIVLDYLLPPCQADAGRNDDAACATFAPPFETTRGSANANEKPHLLDPHKRAPHKIAV